MLEAPILRRIRSFARRDGRMTGGQQQAWENWGSQFLLDPKAGLIDFAQIFGKAAPCHLEIGFGSGQSLAALAKQRPDCHFIGIETFKPGIGALLHQVAVNELSNVRVYYGDAVEILENNIPAQSLQGLQIFFPDPWPKRRHHKRRLIQTPFTQLAISRLQKQGLLHLATDWEDYAKQMMQVLSAETNLINLAGQKQYAPRSGLRPLVTKFEGRGSDAGRPIWELQFARI